jgi:hypothetical protein
MNVRVAGLGKAVRMPLLLVFVRADERYHIMQSVYNTPP